VTAPQQESSRTALDEPVTELRTFLITDIRGYTSYTENHGDEAAARLIGTFAGLVRQTVQGRGGTVIELRGDEALAAFPSARQALRAAVELQIRFTEAMSQDPSLHLYAGVGLDAGDAVRVEGGYRGRALNWAARLCSLAKPGEVLATESVVHLAGKVDELDYLVGRIMRIKGVADPIRLIQIVAPGD
jgi:class 3 adenylate cyclase